MKKVLVAMSGGVDSSVAAFLLKKQGYECIGCTMKLYGNEDIGTSGGHTCCSLSDVEDARSVAYRLGIPYYVFNYSEEFREKVIGRFVCEYRAGRTPNPCIDCNRFMKFDLLYRRAKILGCDFVATGHYARITAENGVYCLKKGADETKDQSYVLYPLGREALAHTLFPLGSLRKSEVRKIAGENGFLNAEKPDSQDICFVPDGDYAKAVERFGGQPLPAGDFVDRNGTVLGRHKGIVRYTVGQRKGLGISAAEPLYVCQIRPASNEIVLGKKQDLFSSGMTVKDVTWLLSDIPTEPQRCSVKIRYHGQEYACTVRPLADRTVSVLFDEPAKAVTPGQSAVFYREDTVLGGGIIDFGF